MSFFSGKDRLTLNGKKKETNAKPIFEFTKPKMVAIPLKHMGSENIEVSVAVGDKVKIGTQIAIRNDHFKLPIFATVSGTVTAIEKRDHVDLKKVDHIVIENDFADEKELNFEPITDLSKMTEDQMKEKLQGEGVLGLGGAAFPTYVKFAHTENIKNILINGVECEPYVTSDEVNMKYNADLLIDAANVIRVGSGAAKCTISVKETKKDVIEAINKHINKYPNIELQTVPDAYPMGWERRLIREVFHLEYDKLPVEVGVVVVNSSTAIEFARTLKTGLPLYDKITTIGGEGMANPQNVKVRIGTLVSEIIEQIGGYNKDVNVKSAALVHGGPMMGKSVITDNLSVTAASNGFLCLYNSGLEEEACSKCGTCVNHCPQGLQPVRIAAAFRAKDKELLKKLGATNCIECGMCSFVCPSSIDVSDATSKAREFAIKEKLFQVMK